jgi:hypothetical protein
MREAVIELESPPSNKEMAGGGKCPSTIPQPE